VTISRNADATGPELRLDTRGTRVFPARGGYLDLFGRWADPAFGGELSFLNELPGGDLFVLAKGSFGFAFSTGAEIVSSFSREGRGFGELTRPRK